MDAIEGMALAALLIPLCQLQPLPVGRSRHQNCAWAGSAGHLPDVQDRAPKEGTWSPKPSLCQWELTPTPFSVAALEHVQ